ncbi:MAG: M23 family metallopeptidase, partial [Parcubacteria group bacterium]|nr:M23 family metallopeptidase [Parcubacteria group bacterium]
SAWTGFSVTNSFGVNTAGKNTLSFAINGGATGGQDLYAVLGSASNPSLGIASVTEYIPGRDLAPNTWYQVNIPLADLGGSSTVINRLSIESAAATTVYYDDIALTYQDPLVFFGDGVGGKWRADTYGANAYYTAPIGGRIPPTNTLGLQVDYLMAWGGLYISDFDFGGGVNTSGKSSVTLAVNTGSTGGEDLYLSLYGADTSATLGTVRISNYLVNPNTGAKYPPNTPLAPNIWYSVVIPLSALHAADTRVTRAGIESDRMGSVWFDDIVIASPLVLKWPLSTTKPATPSSGGAFGDPWGIGKAKCIGLPMTHAGVDIPNAIGNPVYAAEVGVLKEILPADKTDGWAAAIVLEHVAASGVAYTTVYWHVNPVPGLDGFIGPIGKGQKIGTIADISPHGSHLHFGVRLGTYNGILSDKGALPTGYCSELPTFKENFLNAWDTTQVLFQ